MATSSNKTYVKARVKEEAASWVRETASGIASALAVLLFGMVLVQLGLASEGQGFQFSAFAPLEFWESFRGLVMQWSEFNEWVLLAAAVAFAGLTVVVYLRWRSKRAAAAEPETDHDAPRLKRLEARLASLKGVGVFALLTAITMSAYLYQQYLWRVVLPIEPDSIGVAFSRQVGGSVASDQLADFLRQRGHEGTVQMRELPVRFDARDTEKAREMAQRIGADAVVIYRPPGADEGGEDAPAQAGLVPAGGSSAAETSESNVTYIVFADPSVGIEIPVPQQTADGETKGVTFREKEGLEAPRLEASDVGRLMEATAGILLYNEDRMLPAIAHLRNSLSEGPPEQADAITNFYLGNAYSLIDDERNATAYLNRATKLLEAGDLDLQDRLLLVAAYTESARIAFYSDRAEEAKELLQKAIALREPFDKDQTALADPTTYRRFHEAYADVYLQLMDVSTRLGDEDAASLWRDRAREERDALGDNDDYASRLSAIFVSYRTGDCTSAYQAAQNLREENPDRAGVYQALLRLAYLRDGAYTSIESKANLDRLVEMRPDNIADLQSMMLYWSLRKYLEDPTYVAKERAIAERILEVDPSNVGAIEQIVRSADLTLGTELADGTATLRPVGHEPTFLALQAARQRDPELLREMERQVDDIRPYALRWSEEIEPESMEPLVYRASLSNRVAWWYYNYAFVNALYDPGFSPDSKVIERYHEVFAQAVEDADAALDSDRRRDPRVMLVLYTDLIDLWTQRYFALQAGPEDERLQAVERLTRHTQDAVAVVEEELGRSPDDVQLASSTYISLISAYAALRQHHTGVGDDTEAGRYEELMAQASQSFAELGAISVDNTRDDEVFLTREVCPEGAQREKAQELLAEDPAAAAAALKEYVGSFPADPAGLIDLGWAQYLAGDLQDAIQTTQRAREEAPQHPVPAGNLAVFAAAAGEDTEEPASAFLAALEDLPLGLRIQHLNAFSADLVGLARESEQARETVVNLVGQVDRYLQDTPNQARVLHGGQTIVVENNLAAAAIWSGDNEAARALLDRSVKISPDFAIAQANLAILAAIEGDRGAATAKIEDAVAAARTYLRSEYGDPLEGDARTARLEMARGELTSAATAVADLLEDRPDLGDLPADVAAQLRRGAASLK